MQLPALETFGKLQATHFFREESGMCVDGQASHSPSLVISSGLLQDTHFIPSLSGTSPGGQSLQVFRSASGTNPGEQAVQVPFFKIWPLLQLNGELSEKESSININLNRYTNSRIPEQNKESTPKSLYILSLVSIRLFVQLA